MRNYVIINGSSSLNVSGLAIKELPSISKPPMRYLSETIDGRDGDIITKLGYGSYDKELEIGLYDGYDINTIIAFFNGSGIITFSNELDKVYRFEILEQIDYEKLLRFKQAIVTIHCQPFKYPVSETPIVITSTIAQTITNAGNIYSKPTIVIEGNGTINVTLNGSQIFSVTITDKIVIDSEKLEAYHPTSLVLMNRDVTGNIANLIFNKGSNSITFTGDFTKATISNYTRWL